MRLCGINDVHQRSLAANFLSTDLSSKSFIKSAMVLGQFGKAASEAGTKMHYDIECFYNDLPDVEIDEDCVEWDYFTDFENEIGQHLTPYRTEMMVWDKELRLAGSIDMIFENPDGSLASL